jgi:hypothetical protein
VQLASGELEDLRVAVGHDRTVLLPVSVFRQEFGGTPHWTAPSERGRYAA